MIDIKQILDDYNISYSTEGKNTQAGWININCPFCDDPSQHGGFNISKGYYNCWKCGFHHLDIILSALLDISIHQVKKIINDYETAVVIKEEIKKIPKAKKIIFPKGTGELQHYHRDYLTKRNYNPEEITKLWNIKGTNHIGPYKFRIIIPITIDNKIVSFTSRTIIDSELRYKTCQIDKEVIHHKHICYGSDYIKYRKAIIVEGPLDVWRIGPGSIATFGTQFTPKQVLQMSQLLDSAFILYDRDATKEARKLYNQLIGLINHVEILSLFSYAKDPGELDFNSVMDLRKNFLN